jgi:hypothetical protein
MKPAPACQRSTTSLRLERDHPSRPQARSALCNMVALRQPSRGSDRAAVVSSSFCSASSESQTGSVCSLECRAAVVVSSWIPMIMAPVAPQARCNGQYQQTKGRVPELLGAAPNRPGQEQLGAWKHPTCQMKKRQVVARCRVSLSVREWVIICPCAATGCVRTAAAFPLPCRLLN